MTSVYIEVASAGQLHSIAQAKVVIEGDPTPITPILRAFGAHYHRKTKSWQMSGVRVDRLTHALTSRGVAVEVQRW